MPSASHADPARPTGARRWGRALLRGFEEHTLLTYASAIAFQVATAVVPLALALLGLLGLFGLESVWQRDVRPQLVGTVSPEAAAVIDDTVRGVLSSQRAFWVTAGTALAVWQVSGAVRAAFEVVGVVHGVRDERSFGHRYALSLGLGAVLIVLVLGAMAIVNLTPLIDGDPAPAVALALSVLRWLAAGALLLLAVGLVLRLGPDRHEPAGWASLGSLVVVVSLVVASLAFLLYLTQLASYGSVFGALATVVVLFAYLYLASVVFVFGVQVDALLRAELLRPGDEARPEPGAMGEERRGAAAAG